MEGLIDQLSRLLHLDTLDNSSELAFVEKRTGVKPSGFVLAAIVFLIIVSFISNATTLVVGVGCCCLPAYLTFLML